MTRDRLGIGLGGSGFGIGMQLMFARLANTYPGVIIAHTVIAIPFVTANVIAALQGVDRRLENVAASLGASPTIVLRRIILPVAMPGIVSVSVFAFVTSLDEVVLTPSVAGPNQHTVARQMFSNIIRDNISPAIAAAFLFIVGTIIIADLFLLVQRKRARSRCCSERLERIGTNVPLLQNHNHLEIFDNLHSRLSRTGLVTYLHRCMPNVLSAALRIYGNEHRLFLSHRLHTFNLSAAILIIAA